MVKLHPPNSLSVGKKDAKNKHFLRTIGWVTCFFSANKQPWKNSLYNYSETKSHRHPPSRGRKGKFDFYRHNIMLQTAIHLMHMHGWYSWQLFSTLTINAVIRHICCISRVAVLKENWNPATRFPTCYSWSPRIAGAEHHVINLFLGGLFKQKVAKNVPFLYGKCWLLWL